VKPSSGSTGLQLKISNALLEIVRYKKYMPNKKVEMSFPPMIFAFLLDTFALIMPVDANSHSKQTKQQKKTKKNKNPQTISVQIQHKKSHNNSTPKHNQDTTKKDLHLSKQMFINQDANKTMPIPIGISMVAKYLSW
jgi:hypothetical protein